MKTLADFKRAFQPGTIWERKHVKEPHYEKRTVISVHSTYAWVSDEKGKAMIIDFPKASEFAINEAGEAEIYWQECTMYERPRMLVLTYRKA